MPSHGATRPLTPAVHREESWYISDGDRMIGPQSAWEMHMQLRASNLSPTTRVCRSEQGPTLSAAEAFALFDDEDRERFQVNQVRSSHHLADEDRRQHPGTGHWRRYRGP